MSKKHFYYLTWSNSKGKGSGLKTSSLDVFKAKLEKLARHKVIFKAYHDTQIGREKIGESKHNGTYKYHLEVF